MSAPNTIEVIIILCALFVFYIAFFSFSIGSGVYQELYHFIMFIPASIVQGGPSILNKQLYLHDSLGTNSIYHPRPTPAVLGGRARSSLYQLPQSAAWTNNQQNNKC